jgi:adsorption protein A
MRRRRTTALALLASLWLLTPAVAAREQAFELDREVSAYHRFIIYPHLDKGFDAMRRGDRQRALDEFQQARRIAPQSVQTALFLADAYRRFGLFELAQATLDEQGLQTPNDSRLQRAQTQLQAALTSAPSPAGAMVVSTSPAGAMAVTPSPAPEATSPYHHLAAAKALSAAGDSAALAAYLRAVQPEFPNAIDEQQWLALLAQASQGPLDLLNTYRPRFAANRFYLDEQRVLRWAARGDTMAALQLLERLPAERLRMTRFELALKTHSLDAAGRQALALWRASGGDAAQLEALSYRLSVADGQRQAIDLLLAAYPFAEAAAAPRQALLERLTRLLSADSAHSAHSAHSALLSAATRAVLAAPLETVALRSLQVQLFVALGECSTAHGLLADSASSLLTEHSPDNPAHSGADDWRRLGDCYRDTSPGLAQYAYARAQRLRPDAYLTRLLAYQAFATHDYASALDAWRSLPPAERTLDDLKAAIHTALAAHDTAAARAWLDAYADLGGARDDSYWWLRAQADAGNAAAEYADLEQAIAQRPEARYYARLASLQQQSGRPALAAGSLEQAVALEADNPQWLAALAYAYSELKQPANARRSLERVNALRPDDSGIVQQLVYVNQKLGDNEQARRYARQAIDALDRVPAEALSDEQADLRFGFRRLHEDLGRRWRFSVDATSGNVVTPVANAAQPGSSYRSYMQSEAEYRLGDPAINDGKTLAAYGRVFAGSGAQGKALPIHAPMFAAGLRWKPWRQEIIYLAIEQQAPLDHSAGSRVDTMLRVSASFLNGGRFSDDWHATGKGWLAQNLYLDGARFVQGERSAATADYRLSYHHKVAAGQSVEPYAHLQYNLSNPQASTHFDKDVRAGLGVRWNLWRGGDSYNAAPGKFSVGLEVQHAISTFQNEKNSIFLSLGSRL